MIARANKFLFLLSLLMLAALAPNLAAQDMQYYWIEAEDFTTKTKGIKKISSPYALMDAALAKDGMKFLEESGFSNIHGGRQPVSGGAYIELLEGKRTAPNSAEQAAYKLVLPTSDNYYFWFRCDSPPPCWRYISLWLDSPTPPSTKEKRWLWFSHWGVWTWWPWNTPLRKSKYNVGKAEAIHLEKGEHSLFIGNMSLGLKVDKILVTNDPDYVPFGENEHHYTGTFEPVDIKDVHRQVEKGLAKATLAAIGWDSYPPGKWRIDKEPSGQNHYYFIPTGWRAVPEASFGPAHALIRDLAGYCFEVRCQIFIPQKTIASKTDALIVFGFQAEGNFDAVRFSDDGVSLIQSRVGQRTTIQHLAEYQLVQRPQPYLLSVRRGRTDLSIAVDSLEASSTHLSLPRLGSVGVGSYTGGVGFDNVKLDLLEDPSAEFDFTLKDGQNLPDWILIHGKKQSAWTPGNPLQKGDILLCMAPFWSNSELSINLAQEGARRFSLLFPYVNSERFLETAVDLNSQGGIEVIRHYDGKTESWGKFSQDFNKEEQPKLAVQSVNGLFAVLLDGNRIIEANEYELTEGTAGILIKDDEADLPIQHIAIAQKNTIIDSFPLIPAGALLPHWQVQAGEWKTASIMDSQHEDADGQLVALEAGTALIGKDTWQNYLLQISALFDESTELALLGWVEDGRDLMDDATLELLCTSNSLTLRKVVGDQMISLAQAPVPGLSSGWHRIGLTLGKRTVTAEVDGKEVLREELLEKTGRAGLRNYGEFAVFDDLTIHLVSEVKERKAEVNPFDSIIKGILDEIIKKK
jgi:hypothetical protein